MLSLCFEIHQENDELFKKRSAFFHHLPDEAEAYAEPDADEVEGMETMVVQTGKLHRHVNEKIGYYCSDVEKREIQFSISPVAEFKNLIK